MNIILKNGSLASQAGHDRIPAKRHWNLLSHAASFHRREGILDKVIFDQVELVKYLSATSDGSSGAQFMASEDGTQYIAKFKENRQGIRMLVNELVANGIARYLELPCPKGVIAEISSDLIRISNIAHNYGQTISPGKHFATERILNVFPGLPRALIPQCRNKAVYPGIVLFDVLTCNSNRNNDGNYLVQQAGQEFDFYIIDHGHCFGNPNWNASIVQKIGALAVRLLPQVAECITGNDPFRYYFDKTHRLSDEIIDGIVDQVPAEWNLAQAEATALKTFLKGQRDRIEDIVIQHKGSFPNWN